MSDLDFLKAVQRYLYAFNDGHLNFTSSTVTLPYRGFQVRRFENALYVTKVTGEERLQVGDKIIAINDEAIEAVAARYLVYLQSDVFERQLWNNVLPFAETITFIRNNDAATTPLTGCNPTWFEGTPKITRSILMPVILSACSTAFFMD